MHDTADDPSSTQACLSVAKCQYCPRYRKITLIVDNLCTYLLHRFVSDIAIFVLKRDVKLQLTNCYTDVLFFYLYFVYDFIINK